MCFTRLDRLRHSIGFRLAVWYAVIFLVGNLVLFSLSYVLLAVALRQRDQHFLYDELHELSVLYDTGGLDALRVGVHAETTSSTSAPLWVRFIGKPYSFVNGPPQWLQLDLSDPGTATPSGPSPVMQFSELDDEGVVEVVGVRLTDGSLLYLGKSIADRAEVLEQFRAVFAVVFVVVIVLGALSGVVLATRVLAPLRHLTQAASTIYSGEMNARVPIRHTGDELDELGQLFNRMLDNIADLIQGMRQALDNVAHDLRTPMTRLRGIAELALQPGRDPEAHQAALADCIEESESVLTMLNSLMDIAEAETGTMTLQLESVSLNTILEEAVELYREVAEDKGLCLDTGNGPDLRVTADRFRLRQVIANLLDNAIKYTPCGGRIKLRVCQRAQQAILVVEDTGVGIALADLPHIWDRLYRGDRSRTERGLGLGLSLVKAVVMAHQGAVEVSSTPDSGSVFTVSLPTVT
jgi:signal transduction histidine kinase